ncbi:MAG TPA: PadR family transcriptional regulator [Anaerolineales bacterium]|nr:PadR family transcriptional regulator [Anaerolineales bacterium]
MTIPEDLQNNLPLTEATYFILLSLAPEPKHGYAIMKDVQELSHGRINFSTGTLYGAIKRLLEHNWIHRVEESISDNNGQLRKAYALTELGRRILKAEVERLNALVQVAQVRLSEGAI